MFQMQATKVLISGHRWERKKVFRLSEKYPPYEESKDLRARTTTKTGDLTWSFFANSQKNRLPGKFHCTFTTEISTVDGS